MFTMDIPDVPQHYASVMVAQANQTQTTSANKERAMGICHAIDYNWSGKGSSALSPDASAKSYFRHYENKTVDMPPITNAELVAQPKHGKVVYFLEKDGLSYPRYIPDLNYIGDDKFAFKVNVDGVTVKVFYLIKVTDKGADSLEAQDICKETGDRWKISLPNIPVDTVALQPLLESTGINNIVKVDLADLPNGAVGQTVGTTITLDTTAAGHNWFIDTTPWDNNEYLPTSNPYE